jgi:hypothetical protein
LVAVQAMSKLESSGDPSEGKKKKRKKAKERN